MAVYFGKTRLIDNFYCDNEIKQVTRFFLRKSEHGFVFDFWGD